MSGDNNGRWGGSYAYPSNRTSYLEQARDMILMVRSHPSLLFWGGGNELFPGGESPPEEIAMGLEELTNSLDSTRFFIMSSMDGGVNGGDMVRDEYCCHLHIVVIFGWEYDWRSKWLWIYSKHFVCLNMYLFHRNNS